MRTTIKDIARYLNVSTTTVSRALNDKDDISSSMRQKVLEVAKMMDYKPNTIAISLRKKSTSKLLGVIIPQVDHYFFSTVLRGLTTTGYRDDYMILIGESNHSVSREKEIINSFQDHYAAGVVFIPSRDSGSQQNVDLLIKRATPFILIDRTFKGYNGSFIQHDDFEGAYLATQYLIDKGRKKIGMLRGDSSCSISQVRFEGYLAALKASNIEYDSSLIISCTQASKIEGFNSLKMFRETEKEIDALFCITDQLAVGAMECAAELGISIPDQLSVIGYSNSDISQNVSPKLTTVAQDGFQMGKLAKEFLIEICIHQNVIHQKTFPAELIIRNST